VDTTMLIIRGIKRDAPLSEILQLFPDVDRVLVGAGGSWVGPSWAPIAVPAATDRVVELCEYVRRHESGTGYTCEPTDDETEVVRRLFEAETVEVLVRHV
jgi:hypothetical protein